MAHSAKILADSINPDGVRLTTFEVTFPRIVLAEFNTHRTFSRNSASSRAIPVEKMLERVERDPYIPTHWGRNQKGMQAGEELSPDDQAQARVDWILARNQAIYHARRLMHLGVHKQITNRLLEPFLWHTVIVSATDWGNFFHLRCHPDAHPEIRRLAELMREAMAESTPAELDWGEWHLPMISEAERAAFTVEKLTKISVGRCARVSYLTHDGERDPDADIALHDRLLKSGHMSPFEHQAEAHFKLGPTNSNFCPGWVQYRKTLPREWDRLG